MMQFGVSFITDITQVNQGPLDDTRTTNVAFRNVCASEVHARWSEFGMKGSSAQVSTDQG